MNPQFIHVIPEAVSRCVHRMSDEYTSDLWTRGPLWLITDLEWDPSGRGVRIVLWPNQVWNSRTYVLIVEQSRAKYALVETSVLTGPRGAISNRSTDSFERRVAR